MDNAKKIMGRFLPKITFSPGSDIEFSLGLDWQEVKRQPDDILDMAENISRAKKIKYIICIDEFQNISEFDNPLTKKHPSETTVKSKYIFQKTDSDKSIDLSACSPGSPA